MTIEKKVESLFSRLVSELSDIGITFDKQYYSLRTDKCEKKCDKFCGTKIAEFCFEKNGKKYGGGIYCLLIDDKKYIDECVQNFKKFFVGIPCLEK